MITPKEWLSQNKGKTINDYYIAKQNGLLEQTTNDNALLNSVAKQESNESTDRIIQREIIREVVKKEGSADKEDALAYIISGVGLVSFFFPYAKMGVAGLSIKSFSGYELTEVGDAIFGGLMRLTGQVGFDVFQLLFIIPATFIVIMLTTYFKKYSELRGIASILSIVVLGVFIFQLKQQEVREFTSIGIGIYFTIASIIGSYIVGTKS